MYPYPCIQITKDCEKNVLYLIIVENLPTYIYQLFPLLELVSWSVQLINLPRSCLSAQAVAGQLENSAILELS